MGFKKKDLRFTGLIITVVMVAVIGVMVALFPNQSSLSSSNSNISDSATISDASDGENKLLSPHERAIHKRFRQAVTMLHAKQYDYAIKALHEVIALSPKMPEAYVNMGYALIGLKDYKAANDFFNSAIELRVDQVNAYYGLAIALEGMGDLEGALGAMRSYIHLGKNEKPQYIERARSALWEWEAQLKKPDYKRPTGYVPGSLSKSDMDKNLDEKSSILKDK